MSPDNKKFNRRDFLKLASNISAGFVASALKDINLGETLPVPQGHILLSDSDTGKDDLWVVKSDGSDPVRITKDYQWEIEGRFSPDGSKIASVRVIPTGKYLREVAVWKDGIQTAVPTERAGDFSGLSWSANGRYLSFSPSMKDKNPKEVTVFDTQTLKIDNFHGTKAAWSPTGQKIAISVSDGIDMFNYDGKSMHIPTHTTPDSIAWSGKQIYFDTLGTNNRKRIYSVSEDGLTTKLVVHDGQEPRVSPSGKYLLYKDTSFYGVDKMFDIEHQTILERDFLHGDWIKGDLLFSYRPFNGVQYLDPISGNHTDIYLSHDGAAIDFSSNFKRG